MDRIHSVVERESVDDWSNKFFVRNRFDPRLDQTSRKCSHVRPLTMSWIRDQTLSWLQRLSLLVLRQGGPIPRHIAFIMDGNRRFAVKSNIGKSQGHSKGFDKLSEVLQWCLDMGVQEVTVYAFSIENFKRSQEEVDGIFDLARDKFRRLLSEKDKLMELGIRIEVIGNWNMFPKDIIESIAEAMTETRHNNRAVLSVAFAYTSRDEITHSIETIVAGVQRDEIETTDITEELIARCLYTKDRPNPEMLIRSSGETRLSDFLLWQVSSSNRWFHFPEPTCHCSSPYLQTTESFVHFVDVLWPEFKFWHLWAAVFQYQRYMYDSQTTSLPSSRLEPGSRLGTKCNGSGKIVVNGSAGGKVPSSHVDRFVASVHNQKTNMLEELWRHSKS